MIRLAHIVSHPIQYFAHRYRFIARRSEGTFHVFFGSRMGLEQYYDREFGQTFSWKMPILDGYSSSFPGGKEEADGAQILQALDAFDPAAVWIHGYSDRWTRAAWKWARAHRRPVFLSGDSNIRKERRRPFWKRLIKQIVLRPFFRTVSGFLTVGEANEAYYASLGVPFRRFIRFPFTTDPALFDAAAENRERIREEARRRWGIPSEGCVGLWCGKITALKRPLDYVEALRRAREGNGPGPAVWALFAGDGALRREVERRLAKEQLAGGCTGFLNVDEVAQAYAAADFLAHTCDRESYGLVAVEAARMGLPMIVPAAMGAVGKSDAARPGENAWIFEDGDVKELARWLRRMALQPAERARMGAASARISEELNATFEKGVERLLQKAEEGVP